jgi:hypothetical protein
VETKAREFHKGMLGWQAIFESTRISLPPQYHRWVLRADGELRPAALLGRDNGGGGAAGQPRNRAFPEVFSRVRAGKRGLQPQGVVRAQPPGQRSRS